MKYNFKKLTKWVAIGVLSIVGLSVCGANPVMADGYGLTVAPMNQSIIINPGDSYETSFRMSNPSGSTQETYYKIEVEPFYTDENGEIAYSAEADYGEIVKWVTINIPTEGKLEPNDTKEVMFTINVPKNAPAGGQYMSILVTASGKPFDDDSITVNAGEDENAATIKETKRMAHLVYAEIAGSTDKKGEIYDMDLPSFLLSGNITGSATVKNTGNVHGDAKYTLQVFPLFSDEEVYTNEENPATSIVLPDRRVFKEVSWEQTPGIGIFNATFTVEFEGKTEQISKLIIICPVWLLFLIIFIIFAIIVWIVLRAKQHSKKSHRPTATTTTE